MQKVRKRQTRALAKSESILGMRYLRCPGLARAINSTYMVSLLESIGEIACIHNKKMTLGGN